MHLSASQTHQWGCTRRGFEPLTSDLHPESQPLPEAIWAGGGRAGPIGRELAPRLPVGSLAAGRAQKTISAITTSQIQFCPFN